MKKIAIVLILAMAAGAVQAEPNDPNIAAAVAEVQAKVAALDAKVYTGTFTFRELMAARVADINEVVRDVNNVRAQLVQRMNYAGMADGQKKVITDSYRKHTKSDVNDMSGSIQVKHLINDFVLTLSDFSVLDPNDPEYVETVAAQLECIKWFFEEPELRKLLL